MAQWDTMVKLFDAMRSMAADMIEGLPDESFDEPSGEANSPKWIAGHLMLGMHFGLQLLGQPSERLSEMMPTYGPGSPGGRIGDDGNSKESLLEQFRSAGDQLREAVMNADETSFAQPNSTPFLSDVLPTTGDLLAHVFTTHIALHAGQLSQIRREMGLASIYQFS